MARPTTRLTVDRQAELLGCSRSSLLRHRRAGMPQPRAGERPSAWRRRAARWVEVHVARPGRRASANSEEQLLNLRRLRAQRAELRLAQAVEQVHSVTACAAWLDDLVATFAEGMAAVPAALAAGWNQVADQHELSAAARRVVLRAHCAIIEAIPIGTPVAPDAPIALTADPPDTMSLRDRGEFWLAVWRGTRVETERRALARERGDVHDVESCTASFCARGTAYVQHLDHLPDYWGSVLRYQAPGEVRARVAVDLAQALEILRGGGESPLVPLAAAPAADAAATTNDTTTT